MNFVVASMRKLADDLTRALAGHLAPGCLALAGHSLKAATTLGATFESSYLVTFPAADHNSIFAPPS